MRNKGLLILLCIFPLAFPALGATVTIGNHTIAPGGSVVAPLIASGVTDLGAVTVYLTFNPAVVHVTSVAAGTGNALTFGLISNIDNSNGFATISSGSLTGLSGDVIIANFALDAVGSRGTSSPLNIAINLFADASPGNDIPVMPINGTFIITASGTPPGNSGGGGSGGGSGGASGEKPSNIEVIEKYDLQISKDALTSYRFNDVKNPIKFVNITGNTSPGIITASIEVLKNTSTLLIVPPEGLVYKNANIWLGTVGFATPRNIKEALIKFNVDNSWMSANGVSGSDIVLAKWNGNSWIQLETEFLSKDNTNSYFEGNTDSFSPFAITAKVAGVTQSTVTTVSIPVGTPAPQFTGTSSPKPAAGIPTWLIAMVICSASYFIFTKKK